MTTRRQTIAVRPCRLRHRRCPGHCAGASQALPAPSKPIRIVVTFPPGGAPDTLARDPGREVGRRSGQPVTVDNKPGAGGNIGADIVAKAAPDGHTLVIGTVGTHAINAALYDKMPYNHVKDFTPISLPRVHAQPAGRQQDVPAKNVKELIELAKKQPRSASARRAAAPRSTCRANCSTRWPA